MNNNLNNKNPIESYSFQIIDVSKPFPKKTYEVKEYEIWNGGFMIQGMDSPQKPFLEGKENGRNFQDACMRLFLKREIKFREDQDKNNEYFDTKRWDYDSYKNTNWGCILYESKQEALRK